MARNFHLSNNDAKWKGNGIENFRKYLRLKSGMESRNFHFSNNYAKWKGNGMENFRK